MNLQSLIVVVLRLMALDFLLRVALQLAPRVIEFLWIQGQPPVDGARSYMVLPWLMLFGLMVSSALLWLLALPIARFVTRGVSPGLSFGAMSLVDCYSIAFMAVGLFYITSHLPQILNWAHYFLKTAASGRGGSEQGVSGYDVSQAFIPFIVGVVLFVNGRRWASALARRQAEGVSPGVASSGAHGSGA